MTSINELKLYTTNTHKCSYLPEQKAKTLFIDPEFEINADFHTHLSEIGFRRSGTHIYRPHCGECQRCIPCRIVTSDFFPNKRFRRIMNKNSDLKVELISSIADDKYFNLYNDYINSRHNNGDMYPASREQYESFLIQSFDTCLFYTISLEEELLGVMVVDRLNNALSAVFTFYNCDYAKRSLGSFAILWQIAEAQRQDLPYLYLGYWIKDCQKMNYKTQYRPIELLVNQRWTRLR